MSRISKQLKAASKSYTAFEEKLKALQKQQKKLDQALLACKSSFDALVAQTSETELLMDAAISDVNKDHQLAATKQMQEHQLVFHKEYLTLQQQMQHENRSYTAVSNIMKTKHDTVKNSISNIR